jgi:tol-pal system protein YbgF
VKRRKLGHAETSKFGLKSGTKCASLRGRWARKPRHWSLTSEKARIVISSAFRPRRRSRLGCALAGTVLLLAAGTSPVLAQQDDVSPPEPRQAQPNEAAPQAAPAAPGDPVAARIGRLEEQIHDLQVMVAALESLVKAKPSAALPQESAGGDAAQNFNNGAGLGARVDSLETQIGALNSQLELMTQQLGAIDAKLGGAGAPEPLTPPQQGEEPLPPPVPLGRQGRAPADPSAPALADAGGALPAPFAATNISAARPSGEDGTAERAPLPPPARQGATAEADRPQSLAALAPGVDAASLYNQGYGDLLRRDYTAAEISFRQLVQHFPDDRLAGKAQYWLGESYYVRGQFKTAADAFLKGYKTYPSGEKAPDSLLRLGMALAELGQKDAACASLAEFATRFPAADQQLRDEARSELRKARC